MWGVGEAWAANLVGSYAGLRVTRVPGIPDAVAEPESEAVAEAEEDEEEGQGETSV